MSFVSTGNKPAGNGGPVITTPPITGESGDMSTGSAATGVADAAEQMAEQAAAELFGALPEPSGLVKAAVTAAQAAAAAAGISDIVSAAQDAAASLAAGGPGAHNVTVSGSAVPPQMLLFAGINGSEKLGSLFTYIVQLKTPDTLNLGYVSPAANLPLKPMVGKDLCVNIELDGGGKRHISGLVTAARVVEKRGRNGTQHYRWDAEHRLTEVAVIRGSTVRRYGYVYDAPGRRVEKHELDAEGKPYNRTTFLWDGMRLAQECRLGRSSSLYIYSDQGSHEPLARVDRAAPGEADEVLYYHTDVNGAPEEMTDSGGNIVWEAGYQVWGNLTHEKETRPVQQNLRFQGQYLDRETGLHYNLYRFYDPDIGKFISGDPIGLAGGPNLYAYAPNPLGWIDPLGLKVCGLKNKDLGKNGIEIANSITKKGQPKIEILFNNMNDAKNWAASKLGLGKTRMYDSSGKWIGWQNKAGDKVYWGHGDWGKGVGKSTFPHLNYDINGTSGHLFIRDKIINRGQWDEFSGFFD